MEDLYIGQNDNFGIWVQEVMGGYRVLAVARAAGDESPSDDNTYTSIEAAAAAAQALLDA